MTTNKQKSKFEKFNFTDQKLLKLIPNSNKRVWVCDIKQPGLTLQITPSGTKTFKFQIWDKKRKKSINRTIGAYPKVTLNSAREIARKLSNDLAEGVDIIAQAQEEKGEPTLNEAFSRWVTKKKAKGKTSWTFDKMRYDKHIRSRFGNKRVGDISTKALESWFLTLPAKKKLSKTSANRILVIIKTIYNQELRNYPNPTDGITLNSEQQRKRFLRPEEIPAFFEAINHKETPEYLRDYVMLSLYTGARKSNVLGMRWKDIDLHLGIWIIPAEMSKNREDMTVPLIPIAVEILERRQFENKKLKTPSIYVFPTIGKSRARSGHLSDPRGAWYKLLDRAGIENFHIHDLRRTMGSWQTIQGTSTSIVGKSLGHKSQAATAVYSQLNLEPVKKSMQKAVDAILSNRSMKRNVFDVKSK